MFLVNMSQQWIIRGQPAQQARVTVSGERGDDHGKGVARDRVLAATRVAMVHQE